MSARASLASAAAAALLAAAGPAQAQLMREDCKKALGQAELAVNRADGTLRERKAWLARALALDETQIADRLTQARLQMKQDEGLSRTATDAAEKAALQARYQDDLARHNLWVEAQARALIGGKLNPARNPYTPQIQLAERDLLGAQTTLTQLQAFCYGAAPPPPERPAAAAPPPPRPGPAQTPASMQDANPFQFSRRTADQMGDVDFQAPAGAQDVDFTAWSGRYSDGRGMQVDFVGTPNNVVYTLGNASGSLHSITSFSRCKGLGERAWCETNTQYYFPEGKITAHGNIEISRQNGALVGTQRITHVTVNSGTNATGLTEGMGFAFRYGPGW